MKTLDYDGITVTYRHDTKSLYKLLNALSGGASDAAIDVTLHEIITSPAPTGDDDNALDELGMAMLVIERLQPALIAFNEKLERVKKAATPSLG